MSSTLFLFNADFEIKLAGNSLSDKLAKSVDEMATLILPALEYSDRVVSSVSIDKSYYNYLEECGVVGAKLLDKNDDLSSCRGTAWGWNREAFSFFENKNISFSAPTLSSVETINSRRFSFDSMEEAHWGVPHTAFINSIEDLAKAISNSPYTDFVLKPLFGQAGSGFIHSRSFNKEQFSTKISEGEQFIFEPWLEKISDMAMVLSISKEGAVEEVGYHKNICNNAGTFVGTLISPFENRMREAVLSIAKKVFEAGYFGIIGVDGFSYLDSNGKKRMAIGFDINGRYTMSWIGHKVFQKFGAPSGFYRLLTRKRHKLPKKYNEFIELLGGLHYNPETKRGVLLTSPLRITRTDGVEVQPQRSAFMVLGKSEEEVMALDERLRKEILA